MVTCGITGGLYVVLSLFVDAGEPVVCPEKRWENYDTMLEKNIGGAWEPFTFFKDGKFNTAGLIASIKKVWETRDKAVVILNFPNNPTGYMPSPAEMEEVRQEMLKLMEGSDKQLLLLFDDAYEGYVYDEDAMQRSSFYDFVGLHERPLHIITFEVVHGLFLVRHVPSARTTHRPTGCGQSILGKSNSGHGKNHECNCDELLHDDTLLKSQHRDGVASDVAVEISDNDARRMFRSFPRNWLFFHLTSFT